MTKSDSCLLCQVSCYCCLPLDDSLSISALQLQTAVTANFVEGAVTAVSFCAAESLCLVLAATSSSSVEAEACNSVWLCGRTRVAGWLAPASVPPPPLFSICAPPPSMPAWDEPASSHDRHRRHMTGISALAAPGFSATLPTSPLCALFTGALSRRRRHQATDTDACSLYWQSSRPRIMGISVTAMMMMITVPEMMHIGQFSGWGTNRLSPSGVFLLRLLAVQCKKGSGILHYHSVSLSQSLSLFPFGAISLNMAPNCAGCPQHTNIRSDWRCGPDGQMGTLWPLLRTSDYTRCRCCHPFNRRISQDIAAHFWSSPWGPPLCLDVRKRQLHAALGHHHEKVPVGPPDLRGQGHHLVNIHLPRQTPCVHTVLF